MSDLISRQAAIDAISCDITVTGRQNAELVAATIGTFADRIKALPSLQTDLQPTCNDLATDTISRQAAIDAVAEGLKNTFIEYRDVAEKMIGKLPSAQPEIIRCKDCKYGDTFHKFDEPDMPMKCLGQHYGGTYPDDFCSYAERRTDEGD